MGKSGMASLNFCGGIFSPEWIRFIEAEGTYRRAQTLDTAPGRDFTAARTIRPTATVPLQTACKAAMSAKRRSRPGPRSPRSESGEISSKHVPSLRPSASKVFWAGGRIATFPSLGKNQPSRCKTFQARNRLCFDASSSSSRS
jgi:hypothetical protein